MKHLKAFMVCLCLPLLLMNTQCDEDDDFQTSNCGQPVVIDSDFYEVSITDEYQLVSFNIIDDCLTVEVSASGCDGETWSMVLVDSGNVAESSPEQRFLKFIFSNDEACLAVFTQSRVFNLTNLRVDGTNEVVLNIDGLPEAINYMYP